MTAPTTLHGEPKANKEAKRMALAILDVLVGSRSPLQAAELGVTVNAVYLAKSRVLRHLRTELAGFLD